jgi:hypothetical protein
VTILEYVHNRQFCVTDTLLPGRAYAIQIGGSGARKVLAGIRPKTAS